MVSVPETREPRIHLELPAENVVERLRDMV